MMNVFELFIIINIVVVLVLVSYIIHLCSYIFS